MKTIVRTSIALFCIAALENAAAQTYPVKPIRLINEMKTFIVNQGAEPALLEPAQFAAFIKAELTKWARVVKAANVKAE